MKKFWNWIKNEVKDELGAGIPDGNADNAPVQTSRTLFISGTIAQESWFDDDVTPQRFKNELYAETSPVTVHINSPGGDCIAASMIYTMLKEYPAKVTVQIDGMAASAASVIAMAGDRVTMSPTSVMIVHNPWTSAYGNSAELQKSIQLLDATKESIINAYQIKTGLPREHISTLMDNETTLSAYDALELGFCDDVLFDGDEPVEKVHFNFSEKQTNAQLMNMLMNKVREAEDSAELDAEAEMSLLDSLAEAADSDESDSVDADNTVSNNSDTTENSKNESELNPCTETINQNRVNVMNTDTRLEYLKY